MVRPWFRLLGSLCNSQVENSFHGSTCVRIINPKAAVSWTSVYSCSNFFFLSCFVPLKTQVPPIVSSSVVASGHLALILQLSTLSSPLLSLLLPSDTLRSRLLSWGMRTGWAESVLDLQGSFPGSIKPELGPLSPPHP